MLETKIVTLRIIFVFLVLKNLNLALKMASVIMNVAMSSYPAGIIPVSEELATATAFPCFIAIPLI